MIRLLIAVAVLTATVAAPAAATTTGTPALHVLTTAPLRIRGTNFQPGERVTLTLVAPAHRVRRVSVSSAGTFVTNFRDVHRDRCAGFLLRAAGGSGDRAVLRGPQPQCPPP